MVRRVGQDFEYYIQQGSRKLNFFLDQETHDDLKQAILLAEQVPGKLEGERVVIPLQLAGNDQKS